MAATVAGARYPVAAAPSPAVEPAGGADWDDAARGPINLRDQNHNTPNGTYHYAHADIKPNARDVSSNGDTFPYQGPASCGGDSDLLMHRYAKATSGQHHQDSTHQQQLPAAYPSSRAQPIPFEAMLPFTGSQQQVDMPHNKQQQQAPAFSNMAPPEQQQQHEHELLLANQTPLPEAAPAPKTDPLELSLLASYLEIVRKTQGEAAAAQAMAASGLPPAAGADTAKDKQQQTEQGQATAGGTASTDSSSTSPSPLITAAAPVIAAASGAGRVGSPGVFDLSAIGISLAAGASAEDTLQVNNLLGFIKQRKLAGLPQQQTSTRSSRRGSVASAGSMGNLTAAGGGVTSVQAGMAGTAGGRRVWIQPSGPRRPGEGVENEEQGILSAEEVAGTGDVMMRITLLAAGFVIGPSGASVREVVRLSGADINSWTESQSSSRTRRPARVFMIKGEPRCVAQAIYIITAAVDRYKELCEGRYTGQAVPRSQNVLGVTFSYQPPPKSIVPGAASLKELYAPHTAANKYNSPPGLFDPSPRYGNRGTHPAPGANPYDPNTWSAMVTAAAMGMGANPLAAAMAAAGANPAAAAMPGFYPYTGFGAFNPTAAGFGATEAGFSAHPLAPGVIQDPLNPMAAAALNPAMAYGVNPALFGGHMMGVGGSVYPGAGLFGGSDAASQAAAAAAVASAALAGMDAGAVVGADEGHTLLGVSAGLGPGGLTSPPWGSGPSMFDPSVNLTTADMMGPTSTTVLDSAAAVAAAAAANPSAAFAATSNSAAQGSGFIPLLSSADAAATGPASGPAGLPIAPTAVAAAGDAAAMHGRLSRTHSGSGRPGSATAATAYEVAGATAALRLHPAKPPQSDMAPTSTAGLTPTAGTPRVWSNSSTEPHAAAAGHPVSGAGHAVSTVTAPLAGSTAAPASAVIGWPPLVQGLPFLAAAPHSPYFQRAAHLPPLMIPSDPTNLAAAAHAAAATALTPVGGNPGSPPRAVRTLNNIPFPPHSPARPMLGPFGPLFTPLSPVAPVMAYGPLTGMPAYAPVLPSPVRIMKDKAGHAVPYMEVGGTTYFAPASPMPPPRRRSSSPPPAAALQAAADAAGQVQGPISRQRGGQQFSDGATVADCNSNASLVSQVSLSSVASDGQQHDSESAAPAASVRSGRGSNRPLSSTAAGTDGQRGAGAAIRLFADNPYLAQDTIGSSPHYSSTADDSSAAAAGIAAGGAFGAHATHRPGYSTAPAVGDVACNSSSSFAVPKRASSDVKARSPGGYGMGCQHQQQHEDARRLYSGSGRHYNQSHSMPDGSYGVRNTPNAAAHAGRYGYSAIGNSSSMRHFSNKPVDSPPQNRLNAHDPMVSPGRITLASKVKAARLYSAAAAAHHAAAAAAHHTAAGRGAVDAAMGPSPEMAPGTV